MKSWLKKLPVAITRNQQYDKLTRAVIKKVCAINSNCVDVGCHKGEFLAYMLKTAHIGHHFAFEPLPQLYNELIIKFKSPFCHIYNLALSNQAGTCIFQHVVSNPAYSGFLKRKYERKEEIDEIKVNVARLDDIIPAEVKIDFIKIDVEGAERWVLEGAVNVIERSKPVIVFEFGKGGSEYYGTTPEQFFGFFQKLGMKISLLNDWLRNKPCLTLPQFEQQFYNRLNYVFVAWPYTFSLTCNH